ncbi:WD40-repeat-containing domain protein [Lipomyces oligophaga]|uniref:WD40-repeat-containing domain protein n=1 Tax=Lipomyces oligophaga TaxID=45792 RepID=UPI0034CD60B0
MPGFFSLPFRAPSPRQEVEAAQPVEQEILSAVEQEHVQYGLDQLTITSKDSSEQLVDSTDVSSTTVPDESSAINFLRALPRELHTQVLQHLDLKSLLSFGLVSRECHDIVVGGSIWRNQILVRRNRWPLRRDLPVDLDWFGLFKARFALDRRWQNGQFTTRYLTGHADTIYCIQVDSDRIVTGSRDKTIIVWDAVTAQQLHKLERWAAAPVSSESNVLEEYDRSGHEASVICLQFDTKHLISGSSDSTLIVWDSNTYTSSHRLRGHTAEVIDLSFDTKYIASCSKDRTIIIRSRNQAENFPILHRISSDSGTVNSLHLRRGILAAGGISCSIHIWKASTGRLLRRFRGHDRSIASVKFSSDCSYVFSGSNDDNIRVFDVQKGSCIRTLVGHSSLVRSLCITYPRVISASYDRSIKVWDMYSLQLLLDLDDFHPKWILAVDADARMIISSCLDGCPLVMDFASDLDRDLLSCFKDC